MIALACALLIAFLLLGPVRWILIALLVVVFLISPPAFLALLVVGGAVHYITNAHRKE